MGSNCSKVRREDGDTTAFSKNKSLSWRRKKGDTEGRIAEGNSLIGGETPCQQSFPSLQSPFSPAYNPQFSLTAEGRSNLCAPVISNNEVGGSINITQNITQNIIQKNDDPSQVAQCSDTQKKLIQRVKEEHKASLKQKFNFVFEGTEEEETSLNSIYTQLYITLGENEGVNKEHEVWQIEYTSRRETSSYTPINSNDIFKPLAGQEKEEKRPIKTVLTKGIAGIGKTVSVQKFVLDWAEGKANQDLDFIFVLPFRELHSIKDDELSLHGLINDFHPELTEIENAKIYATSKVLFIFDGLDEKRHPLKFNTKRVTDVTKTGNNVDVLVTNLIEEKLLPKALIWITSRPAAANQIPRRYINLVTEVRGFDERQKEEYFKKRVKNGEVARRIIAHITTSRTFKIMCHIPVFCWISAKVLEELLRENVNGEIPTTLTEMYTHFLLIQIQLAQKDPGHERDKQKIWESNKDFLLKLGKLAFEHLEKRNLMFYEEDLNEYGIDISEVAVYSALCTEIFKEEKVYKKKVYCFMHLTIQEFVAALFVFHCFTTKSLKTSSSLKSFLMEGSEPYLKAILEKEPVDLPLDELMEITMYNSVSRENGEMDMFLRFLLGMSMESVQCLLQGLLPKTENSSEIVKEMKIILKEMDLIDVSPERCLNLFSLTEEVKDHSLHEDIQRYLSEKEADRELSPAHCSVLAYVLLMSEKVLDEFVLKKYKTSQKGFFRLLPAVRNCRKAIFEGVYLDRWYCATLASALQLPNSPLRELHLIDSIWLDSEVDVLCTGLSSRDCKLEALSLCGNGLSNERRDHLVSSMKTVLSCNLRELGLSNFTLQDSVVEVLSTGLGSQHCKLEILRLNRNTLHDNFCEVLVSAISSNSSHLKELDIVHCDLIDSRVELLSTGLKSPHCKLEKLRLYQCNLNNASCEALASAIKTIPSHLRELDLSNNDLKDSGVKLLSTALGNPHCKLETLRLPFCRVTEEGCDSLASALTSNPSHLRELDLSYNHPGDSGVKMLSATMEDPDCRLKINIDHNEECWVNLELLKKYACDLTLDPNTANKHLSLSEGNRAVRYEIEEQPYPDHPERFYDAFQVLCREGLTERHYWEMESTDDVVLGVTYKGIKRKGSISNDFVIGHNDKSWCMEYKTHFCHNGADIEFPPFRDPSRHRIGVYLDWPAGTLSFYTVFSDTLTHLYTFHTTFTEPLYPAFGLAGCNPCSVSLCQVE
ncbi:NACHT, LRR and PYD domains-containing protein 12 isoform X1 [Salmo salar]|uniref:NACHT, LRR and PYD domains-containing protein 12-like isoform X1 n=1 Tax=Salmo salar TaxID=8030 RepID=A0ABM3EXD0_SALSA|nr:NACHT, LRR and PYD domains-containing protein 12-like isoform X1 [Salmo salar]XP_045575724.1 NACHT, LRR and PYD domains-containing protein 12-like isoform X1 [Salmo salar]XP_045575725.1 NACHT, LRR and PYD domains-containing protein 12-like isoform X1 [Salmo salar]